MEVVGFAIGAGSLLIEGFDKSVRAYEIYSIARDFGKGSAHLVAKLLIEEQRLIQWGRGVGLSSGLPEEGQHPLVLDERLREGTRLYSVVAETLSSIQETLTDVSHLKSKYGLQVFEEDTGNSTTSQELQLPLRSKQAVDNVSVVAAYHKSRESRNQNVQTSTSHFRKFKWAIKDKVGFEMLLKQLKYYNDSLYSLLPKMDVSVLQRDVLAYLLKSANVEVLSHIHVSHPGDQDSILPTENVQSAALYERVATDAELSVQVKVQIGVSDAAETTDMQISADRIQMDSDSSNLGTYAPPGSTEIRVFLERKLAAAYDPNEDSLRKQTFDRISKLARLLKSLKATEFRTLKCIGFTVRRGSEPCDTLEERRSHIHLVYELPKHVDPLAAPVTLQQLLSDPAYQSDEPPPLDERFELASVLARSLFEMHTTGWLHRNFSTESIFFLQRQDTSKGLLERIDLAKPYISGFEVARALSAESSLKDNCWDFSSTFFKHPGYVFRKEVENYNRDNSSVNCDMVFYQPRHEYYSLSLLLLEIGLWKAIGSVCLASNSSMTALLPAPEVDESPLDLVQKLDRMKLAFHELQLMAYFDISDIEDDQSDAVDELLGRIDSPECDRDTLIPLVLSLRGLIGEEGLPERKITTEYLDYSFMAGGAWARAVPLQKLREDAVQLCRSRLGSRMGKRYRDAVLCCLTNGLSVAPDASTLDWLRAFNWKVVKELEKCSA